MSSRKFDPSRRDLCRQSAVLAGGAVAAGLLLKSRAFAQSQKAPQSAVQYQGHPKGQDECDRCTHFIPGKTSSAGAHARWWREPSAPKVGASCSRRRDNRRQSARGRFAHAL